MYWLPHEILSGWLINNGLQKETLAWSGFSGSTTVQFKLLAKQRLWGLTKALNETGVQDVCEEWLGELSEVLFQ